MNREKARRLFLAAFFLFALANGLSGSIISNYFKDVFQVDSVQRGLLEIPRELPGVVGVFVIAALPSLGNLSLSILGFVLYCVGLLVLGLFSPGYFVMQLFVFTYSLGDHMVMPIRDAIAMDLADDGKTGTFLGKYRGMMTLGSMLASALVFVGFRTGFFYFRRGVIPSFFVALAFLSVSLVLLCRLRHELPALDVRKRDRERKGRLPIRRKYIPYYIVTAVYGFQKRMRLVFAPWVIIELLSLGADTVALLGIAAYFCGSWVAPLIGKFLDKYGVQKGLVLESFSIAAIFLFAAWAAAGIVNGFLSGWAGMAAAFVSYVLIFLTDHFNSVHTMLMRELSESLADVMENLSFGLSVDHVLAVTVSGLLGAVWKYAGAQYVFLLGAAVCSVHLGVALWLKKHTHTAV
ncbi:hypothetical protein JQM63_10725 [Oscillibacter valericigenes]|nr:hypothetical protein [Oscillibacter valericigenes]